MAELFDKIIQNGITSFVPRSNKTRAFWMKQNAKVAGSEKASKETVTIMPATDEEVAEWLAVPVAAPTASAVPAQIPINSQALEVLQKQMQAAQDQIQKQQDLILQLMAEKERNKPGPKPKTDTNG